MTKFIKSNAAIILTTILGIMFGQQIKAQTWEAPQLPGEDLSAVKSSLVGYLYNVDTDAFLINGMDGNTSACATRLTNGDYTASVPQRAYIFVGESTLKIRLKDYSSYYVSCTSDGVNAISVNKNTNTEFSFAETASGTRTYILKNEKYGKDLDVSWNYGGHLTLNEGAGKTRWAFISETSVTNGAYALYKSKLKLYNLYLALKEAGVDNVYQKELTTAYKAYTSTGATVKSINEASVQLFSKVYGELTEPIDVSFVLNNPDMVGNGNTDGWDYSSNGVSWGEFEKYHTTYSMEQTASIPIGTYDFGFHALYREDGTGNAPVFQVTASNTVKSSIPLMSAIDFGVSNATNNNWTKGSKYYQPNGMQSCSQALASESAVAWAKGVNVSGNGEVAIKVSVNSNNQWFNWQGFEVIYQGISKDDLLAALQKIITEATTLYGNGSGNGAADLNTAITQAQAAAGNSSATKTELQGASNTLSDAIKTYRNGNASVDNPIDKSDWIVNPSFEQGTAGWEVSGLGAQSNTSFSIKKGTYYMEKWTGQGGKVGDGKATQLISGVEPGIYQLIAAAQNIQEGSPNANQSGAWIVANSAKEPVSKRGTYTLTFTNIESEITIGFVAEGATGNWIACDNFKIQYVGGSFDDLKAALQSYLDNANALTSQHMHTATLNTLNDAISAAQAELSSTNADGYPIVATPLRKAMDAATISINAYKTLDDDIKDAETTYGDGTGTGADDYLAAINAAKAAYNDGTTSFDELAHQSELLANAKLIYQINQPKGAVPTITSDKRYARGATMAFGRFTYKLNGAKLRDCGFCYSTDKNPDVTSQRSTRYLDNNGRIYIMDNMKPATVYYARPYVLTEGYQVAYGELMKIITLPQGHVTWWYNNGGSAEENDRINYALQHGTEIWNAVTSIQNVNLSVSYGSGTPTADCSYGGSMRVGPNASYQRTGTILHEAAHAVGIGTQGGWWGMLIDGVWTGNRANAVLQFWDNDNTTKLHGDSQHLWPYGINGAHEDNGSDYLYYAQGLIVQGCHEDGVAPSGGCFASPAYQFEQEDDIKYYIKNEDSNYGLNTSYLTISGTSLAWKEASSEEATSDDSFAWYTSFDPATQFYSFRNAKTGAYITISGSTWKVVSREKPAASEKFQLMLSRSDLKVGGNNSTTTMRGYWILKANGGSATALTGAAKGAVNSSNFNNDNNSTNQRWLILTAMQTALFDNASTGGCRQRLQKLVNDVTTMVDTPHDEDTEGADDAIDAALGEANTLLQNTKATVSELTSQYDQLYASALTFIGCVTPSDIDTPLPITFLIEDNSIENGVGWTGAGTINNSAMEFYETTYDLYQTIENMPAATYLLTAQAFCRPGENSTIWQNYNSGSSRITARLYANTYSQTLCHVADGASDTRLHSDDYAASSPAGFIPNTMASARVYFDKGKYSNQLLFSLSRTTKVKLGVKQTTTSGYYWTMVDNIQLYSYGSMSKEFVTSITDVTIDSNPALDNKKSGIYNLAGQRLTTPQRGLNIIDGKKVWIE